MTIKLQCITGGFKYGDLVKTGKDTITNAAAKTLVEDGFAVEVVEVKEAKKKG